MANTNESASEPFTGILKGSPKITNDKVDELLDSFWNGKLATVDGKPSIRSGNGWMLYDQSEHFRTLHTLSNVHINKEYSMYADVNYKIPRAEMVDILGWIFGKYKIDLFQEWVNSVEWDRLDRLRNLHKAIGLSCSLKHRPKGVTQEEDEAYCIAIVHMIVVGAVQRRMETFTQNYVPVLIGNGNCGKSSTLSALGQGIEKWYTEIRGTINVENNGREFYRPQFGKAIVEIAEIDSFIEKHDTGLIKSLLDAPIAEFNEKHSTGIKRVPLTAFIVGTTNHDQFLQDETGNRRFVPVYMTMQKDTPNRELLKGSPDYLTAPLYLPDHPEYVQQLYAQALYLYKQGIKYDYYADVTDPKCTFIKVRDILNACALREDQYMEELVRYIKEQVDRDKYRSACWAVIKRDFSSMASYYCTKQDLKHLFNSFSTNPSRFGFSELHTVRIQGYNETVRGIRLEDPEKCENFLNGFDGESE